MQHITDIFSKTTTCHFCKFNKTFISFDQWFSMFLTRLNYKLNYKLYIWLEHLD